MEVGRKKECRDRDRGDSSQGSSLLKCSKGLDLAKPGAGNSVQVSYVGVRD